MQAHRQHRVSHKGRRSVTVTTGPLDGDNASFRVVIDLRGYPSHWRLCTLFCELHRLWPMPKQHSAYRFLSLPFVKITRKKIVEQAAIVGEVID